MKSVFRGSGALDLWENSCCLTTTPIHRDTPPLFSIWSKILIDKVSPVLDVVILHQRNKICCKHLAITFGAPHYSFKQATANLLVVCSVDDTCNGSISWHRFLVHREVTFLEFSCLDSVDEATADVAAVAAAAAVAAVAIDFSAKASFLESGVVAAAAYAGAVVVVARGSVEQPQQLEGLQLHLVHPLIQGLDNF